VLWAVGLALAAANLAAMAPTATAAIQKMAFCFNRYRNRQDHKYDLINIMCSY
jgi:hypothetical protein